MSAAAPARFDAARQRRRAMIAKVHVAQKALGLIEDDYRAVLLRVGGATSAAELADRDLEKVLAEFTRLGFSARAKRTGAKPADHPTARKARAMWISLGQLTAISDPSEAALEAFARRQLGCERMQWADQRLGYRLIEALKAIAQRAGWDQDLSGVKPAASLIVLKRRLVTAIYQRLIEAVFIPLTWTVERAARELGGVEVESVLFASASELDSMAQAMGTKLRAMGVTGERGAGR